MQHLSKVLIFAFFAAITGCSGKQLPPDLPQLFPCKIIIQQEGKPLADAQVFLSPVDGSKWNATGNTNTQGVTEPWTQGMYRGVAEGKFKVVVFKQEIINPPAETSSASGQQTEEPKVYNLIEEIYSEATKTPLSIEVSSSQSEWTLDIGK
ncbi:MAG: hypothetical protein LBJ67_16365, partial [Planctomycetaceae bacterium]|nr:hypothetical protein [Planctomycetaceae bacterium]